MFSKELTLLEGHQLEGRCSPRRASGRDLATAASEALGARTQFHSYNEFIPTQHRTSENDCFYLENVS